LLCQRTADMAAIELSKCFDAIPHDELLHSVAAWIVDRHVVIKAWLKAMVEETDPAAPPAPPSVAWCTQTRT